jgi:cell division protein FtsI (penicillin-binding protein 3)
VVTVQYALEHSSDVGAAKMALKVGPETFYKYIKGFGFGDRSGIELPSETRGLLTNRQEVGLDQHPVACDRAGDWRDAGAAGNHGEHNCQWRRVYAAAHPAAIDRRDEGRPAAAARGLSAREPASGKLPDGAHRVIKELTAAKMRSMMQGIVMEGTGKLRRS